MTDLSGDATPTRRAGHAFSGWRVTAYAALVAGLARAASWSFIDALLTVATPLYVLASLATAGGLVVGWVRDRWAGRVGAPLVALGLAILWLWWSVAFGMAVVDEMSSHRVVPDMYIHPYPSIMPGVYQATAWGGVAVDIAATLVLIGGAVRMLRRLAPTP